MPVIGYVGLPGSGKTLALVRDGIEAYRSGREVWANFRLGRRFPAAMMPCCALVDVSSRTDHECEWVAEPLTPEVMRSVMRQGWRIGRGFVPSPGVRVIKSWDELMALRVKRDPFGIAHASSCPMRECAGCSRGITVLLDELNLWAPSRLWQKLGIGVLTRWAYVRKDGMDVRWSAQHESRIDKVAREVTDFIWTCRSVGPFSVSWVPVLGWLLGKVGLGRAHFFMRRKWIPALITESNRSNPVEGMNTAGLAEREFTRFRTSIAEAYDTYEHVAASTHLAEDEDEGARPAKAGRRALRVVG